MPIRRFPLIMHLWKLTTDGILSSQPSIPLQGPFNNSSSHGRTSHDIALYFVTITFQAITSHQMTWPPHPMTWHNQSQYFKQLHHIKICDITTREQPKAGWDQPITKFQATSLHQNMWYTTRGQPNACVHHDVIVQLFLCGTKLLPNTTVFSNFLFKNTRACCHFDSDLRSTRLDYKPKLMLHPPLI